MLRVRRKGLSKSGLIDVSGRGSPQAKLLLDFSPSDITHISERPPAGRASRAVVADAVAVHRAQDLDVGASRLPALDDARAATCFLDKLFSPPVLARQVEHICLLAHVLDLHGPSCAITSVER